jgi:hypothetical protein
MLPTFDKTMRLIQPRKSAAHTVMSKCQSSPLKIVRWRQVKVLYSKYNNCGFFTKSVFLKYSARTFFDEGSTIDFRPRNEF